MRKMALILFVIFFSTSIFGNRLSKNDFINRNNDRFSLGLSSLNLNYNEFNPGDPYIPSKYLDRETGEIYGIDVVFSKAFKNDFYYSISVAYYTGKLIHHDYNEYELPAVPFTLTFKHKFFLLNAKVGHIILINFHFQVIPFVTAGYRLWKRFNSVKFQENYKNAYIGIGSKFNWQLTHRLIFSQMIDIGRTIFSHLCTPNASYPEIKFSAPLGNSFYYQLATELNYFLTQYLGIGLYASYMSFNFGESAVIDGAQEPNSKTKEFIYGVQLNYLY